MKNVKEEVDRIIGETAKDIYYSYLMDIVEIHLMNFAKIYPGPRKKLSEKIID